MPTFVPASERIPGAYQQVLLTREPGLLQSERRVLLLGWRLSAASADNDLLPVRVRTRAEGVALYHSGSQLDLMIRQVLSSGEKARLDSPRGSTPAIYCVSVPPPAGTAATQVMTATGTATSSGEMFVSVNGNTRSVQVLSGDDATTIALSIVAAITALGPDIAATAGSALGVVTVSAREPGIWGEELVLSIDDSQVAGASVAITDGVLGAGLADFSAAIDVALEGEYDVMIVPQDDTTTRALLKPHILDAWDYTNERDHGLLVASAGDLSDAQTAASTLDDWRLGVTCAEKITGAPNPWDLDSSSKALSFEVVAAVGARLRSQSRANYNFNRASLPCSGRPRNLPTSVVNDAINAGVLVVLEPERSDSVGEIVDPISTAITDQSAAATGASDLTWQPLEILFVVQQIRRSMRAELDNFVTLIGDDETLRQGRDAAFAVLNEATRAGLIQAVTDQNVSAEFVTVGPTQRLVIDVSYNVIVGVDIVEITHNVSRAG